jgi:RNA polymerase sigma-70 factor (ECF subfamily)
MEMNPTKEDFVRLWTSAQPGVAAYVSAMVPDHHAAEDVLQECAAVLLLKFSSYDSSRSFLSWAIGVCRIEIFSRRRRHTIERLVFDDAALQNIAQAYDELGDEVDDRIRALRYCTDKIQGRSRQLLDLRYAQNLKPRDIAKRFGSTPNATTVALARIRAALRRCIQRLLSQKDPPPAQDMVAMSEAYVDQTLTPGAAQLLRDSVVDDMENAKALVCELLLHRQLYDILQGESALRLETIAEEPTGGSEWRYQSVMMPAIVETPGEPDETPISFPAVPAIVNTPEQTGATPILPLAPAPPADRPWQGYSILQSYWWKAAAVVLLAVGVGLSVLLHHRVQFATVTQTIDAKWDDGISRTTSTQVPNGDVLSLQSGFCGLRCADGTQVIVQGPARFTMQSSDRILLSEGKIVAAMSSGAKQFVVATPSCTVTDLGTEFGVSVEPATGITGVDVFRGSVHVVPAGKQTASMDVTAGSAVLVENQVVHAVSAVSSPQRFVRSLSSPPITLDIADLLSGGDGSTHRRGGMIDPSSGASGELEPVDEFGGDNVYHRVPALPVVDGCFVPDGANGSIQVDSAGDRVPLPKTDGASYDMIVGGNNVLTVAGATRILTVVGGVDYSKEGHWLLFLHANVGITFDLAAIRRCHPGLSLSRFYATVGNSFPRNLNGDVPGDMYCFVDGVSRFERKRFSRTDTFTLDVPLNDTDRFLTIVTTDGGVGNSGHDILLGDCVLETHASE